MPYLPKAIKKSTSNWKGGNDTFLASSTWRRFRKWIISEIPYCESCLLSGNLNPIADKGQAQIDHIVRREDGGAFYDPKNISVLCRSCHAKKNALERHGLKILKTGLAPALCPAPGEKERVLKKLLT